MAHPDTSFRAAVAAITAADTYEEAVDRCAEHSAEVLLSCCVISLLSEDGNTLYPIGLAAPDPGVVEAVAPILGAPLPSDQGFAGHALREGGPVLADGITADDLRKIGSGYADAAERFGAGAALGVPLKTRQRPLGAISCVSQGRTRRFSEVEVGFVSDVAAVLALRVEADLLAEAPRPKAVKATAPASMAEAAGTDLLTARERQVLGLLAVGFMNKEIGEQLSLSVRTVEWHRARIQWKLGLRSRAELVKVANELGVISDAE